MLIAKMIVITCPDLKPNGIVRIRSRNLKRGLTSENSDHMISINLQSRNFQVQENETSKTVVLESRDKPVQSAGLFNLTILGKNQRLCLC
jgi:hypothetical protein